MGKKNPLNVSDLAEFVQLSKSKEISENSWLVDATKLDPETWDLTVNNPNDVEEVDDCIPMEIIVGIEEMNDQVAASLRAVREII